MRKLAISMLLGLLAFAPGARAKDYPSRGSTAYPAPTLHGELRLSLAEAISMGLENNLGIEIERHAPLIAHEDYEAAWGSYDPIWNAEFGYSDVEDPTANVLLGTFVGEFKTVDGWGGFSGLVPWRGASYDLRYIGSDRRTNSSIQALSPELRSEVSFALTLPLLTLNMGTMIGLLPSSWSLPHWLQKRAPSAFSAPQLLQVISIPMPG